MFVDDQMEMVVIRVSGCCIVPVMMCNAVTTAMMNGEKWLQSFLALRDRELCSFVAFVYLVILTPRGFHFPRKHQLILLCWTKTY